MSRAGVPLRTILHLLLSYDLHEGQLAPLQESTSVVGAARAKLEPATIYICQLTRELAARVKERFGSQVTISKSFQNPPS